MAALWEHVTKRDYPIEVSEWEYNPAVSGDSGALTMAQSRWLSELRGPSLHVVCGLQQPLMLSVPALQQVRAMQMQLEVFKTEHPIALTVMAADGNIDDQWVAFCDGVHRVLAHPVSRQTGRIAVRAGAHGQTVKVDNWAMALAALVFSSREQDYTPLRPLWIS